MNIQELILACNNSKFEWAEKNTWKLKDITIRLMDSTALAVSIEFPEKRFVVVPLEVLEKTTFQDSILENVDYLANAGTTYEITYKHREQGNTLVDKGIRYLPLWVENFTPDYEIIEIREEN